MPSKTPAPVRIDGALHDVQTVTGTEVSLVNRLTGTTVTMHPAELARGSLKKPRITPRALEQLSTTQIDHIGSLADHIREVDTGVWHDGSVRERYDPATTTQEMRVARKVEDLKNVGTSTSRATIMRDLADFRAHGPAGLIDGRWAPQRKPSSRFPAKVLDILLDVLNEATQASTRTRKYVIQEVRRRTAIKYGESIRPPSDKTMYRKLKQLDDAKYLTAAATTRKSDAKRPQRTLAKNTQYLPGAEVQVDSTPLDIMVWAGDKMTRPVLTTMVDVATRMILAQTLRIEAAKSADHVDLLLQAFTPRQNRVDKSRVRAVLNDSLPAGLQLMGDVEYQELATAHPFIRPRAMQMDNGNDFRGRTLGDAGEFFGMDVTLSAPYTPTDKPHVERANRTIKDMFIQYLPGFTGGSVAHRGKKPEDDELLTLDMLRELLDDWVMRDYHQRPHESLRDQRRPTVRISPLEMARQATFSVADFAVPISPTQHIGLLPTEWRIISSVGVTVATHQYDSDELHQHRGKLSKHTKHKGKWPVKVPPYVTDVVWVEVADGEYIECRERGSEVRLLKPHLPPLPAETMRGDAARLDAALLGLPHPQATPAVAPATFDDDDQETDDFDYDNVF